MDLAFGRSVYAPEITSAEWFAELEACAGRPLSPEERERADQLSVACAGMLRPVAERLFGAAFCARWYGTPPAERQAMNPEIARPFC